MDAPRTYPFVTATLLAIVAIAHLVRAIAGWSVVIDGFAVPVAVSWVGALGAAALSAWGVRYATRR